MDCRVKPGNDNREVGAKRHPVAKESEDNDERYLYWITRFRG
ncbi:MAG: hypothetical protein OJF62_002578 [Pseudolabrys sp.]|nr:hypothetical protein [Pseudolabrys sp.]